MTHKMSRKEALAAIVQLRKDYLHLILMKEGIDQFKQESETSWEAIAIIMQAIIGPCRWPQFPFLCEGCSMRYAEYRGKVQGEQFHGYYCLPCIKRLRAEDKLIEESQR